MAIAVFLVAHKGNGGIVRAERGTCEGKASLRITVGLADSIAPAFCVATVVNLVQNHQRALGRCKLVVLERMHRHLCVSNHNSVVLGVDNTARVRKMGIQGKPGTLRGLSPLHFKVLGRHDHDDSIDGAVACQFCCDAQGESRFARTGGGDREKVLGFVDQVLGERRALPSTKLTTHYLRRLL